MGDFRWIIDAPANGPTNMARDEAILDCVGRHQSPPTLRFYRWSPATISLGYFQAHAEYAALPPPAGGLAVVRRQTGGGAILHDLELTYSLTLPLDHPWIATAGPVTLYDRVHSALAAILVECGVPVARPGSDAPVGCSHGGPFFCFENHSRFDLLADGKKLLGSAQRRTANAVLQHGSLVLANRFPQHICATVADYSAMDLLADLPRLADAIVEDAVEAPSTFSAEEIDLAGQLHAKYADPAWTQKR